MNSQQTVLVVGIAGSSGSGKSFFADVMCSAVTDQRVFVLSQDHYYKDLSQILEHERERLNFDHPDAIDFSLLEQHLLALKDRQPIQQPLYDFAHHNRLEKTIRIEPADIVILDGILVLAISSICQLCDIKIYVETPLDLCFIRRLQRDIVERGRTVDSVISQYCHSVRPMFLKYVRPCRDNADYIVQGQGNMIYDRDRILNDIKEVCLGGK